METEKGAGKDPPKQKSLKKKISRLRDGFRDIFRVVVVIRSILQIRDWFD